MGYSIATPIKSKKAQREMLEFLQRHYNSSLDVDAVGPLDRGLSYDPYPCRIGFNGKTISDYMIGVCAWIALKVGKTKVYPTKANPKVNGPYKYIVYDGREDWPLYFCHTYRVDLPHLVQVTWVGSLAPRPRAFWHLFHPPESTAVYEELNRLNNLWALRQLERQ